MSDGIIHRTELDTFHKTGYLSGANVYATAFTTKKGVSRFCILFSAVASAILTLTISNGTDTESVTLNEGVALTAGALYELDIRAISGYSYNLKYAANTTISIVQVDEIVQES